MCEMSMAAAVIAQQHTCACDTGASQQLRQRLPLYVRRGSRRAEKSRRKICEQLTFRYNQRTWAVSSVVEHLAYTDRVGGSKPSPPISFSIRSTSLRPSF